MALYLIGDVQGCDDALARLLDEIAFSPSRDTLVLLGDLVNRGPQSLAVLRRMVALEASAHCLLGNHDLHLLAVAHGVRKPHRSDTLDDILQAPDRAALLDWLRARPLALQRQGWLMVHAGVLPQWDAAQTHDSLRPYLIEEAHEVDDAIRDGDDAALREELGDLLLQVLFHSVVAEERGAFSMHDVAAGLIAKMHARHPHLYPVDGELAAERPSWEAMKAKKRRGSIEEGLPSGLPSLHRAHRLQDRAAGVGTTVSKVASGAAESVPYFMVTNLARTLDELKERNIWIVGADERGGKTLYEADLPDSIAWVLGAEGEGMRRLTREKCDFLVRIPMQGLVESLNVSVASGVCLYESLRRRTSPVRARGAPPRPRDGGVARS